MWVIWAGTTGRFFPLISEALLHEDRRTFDLHETLFRPQMDVNGCRHFTIALTERGNAAYSF